MDKSVMTMTVWPKGIHFEHPSDVRLHSEVIFNYAAGDMLLLVLKFIIAAGVVIAVSEIASRSPQWGALLLSLPTVSIITFILTWYKEKKIDVVADLSLQTFFFVVTTLPFFLVVAYSGRLHLGFWTAMLIGVGLSGACIYGYLYLFAR